MQEATVQETKELWYVIPNLYEKWTHPSSKNDKHYRVIFRSNLHGRRLSKIKFKRAFDAQVYAARFDVKLCTRRVNEQQQ